MGARRAAGRVLDRAADQPGGRPPGGSSPPPSPARRRSRSRDRRPTGSGVASTIARRCASASSRVTAPWPSRRPSEKASPALVVASASKPSAARIRAVPASHGFGITNAPGRSWRARNALALSSVVMRRTVDKAARQRGRTRLSWIHESGLPLLRAAARRLTRRGPSGCTTCVASTCGRFRSHFRCSCSPWPRSGARGGWCRSASAPCSGCRASPRSAARSGVSGRRSRAAERPVPASVGVVLFATTLLGGQP